MKHIKLFEHFISDTQNQSSDESNLALNEATRAEVGIIDKNGNITTTYVHYDGYPEHTGKILKKYYDFNKIKQLLDIDGGKGISSLEKDISGGPGHSFNTPLKDQTIFYGRDRGEKGGKYSTGKANNMEKFISDVENGGIEYIYLYDERDKKWYHVDVYGDQELKTL